MTEIHEGSVLPPAENKRFPPTGDAELVKLKDIIKGKNADITPIGELGYLIHNKRVAYVAEAPLLLLDWDDTGVATQADKGRCWKELEGMGISKGVIKYCDTIARVDIGHEDPAYQPELEMRLLTHALSQKTGENEVELTDELKAELDQIRENVVAGGNLEDHEVDPKIEDVHQRTRFTSTLFPDTLDTMSRLHGNGEWPNSNVAILTYGDPAFQLTKTAQLLDGEDISQIFITKAAKGKFFQEVLRQNPFKDIPLRYKYPETPRGIGVNFKDWKIPIVLFDDDPKQVKSFNSIAETEGISALGVVRVRRQGVKRADTETELGQFTAEINPSDTYLDTKLFETATQELYTRAVERYIERDVVPAVKLNPNVLSVPDVMRLIFLIANDRKIPPETIKHNILVMAGFKTAGTFPTDDPDVDRTVYVEDKV